MNSHVKHVVHNADNDGLGPVAGNGFVIGYVDKVNGPGSAEHPDFVCTCHELRQLVKYWTREILDIRWFYFLYGQTGSTEIRVGPYANSRIARIEEELGEEQVDRAVEEAREEFRKEQDQRLWEIFVGDDPVAWNRVSKDIMETLAEDQHPGAEAP